MRGRGPCRQACKPGRRGGKPTKRRVAVPHGGHGTFFRGHDGKWCSGFFGSDRTAPFRTEPALVPLKITPRGRDLLIEPAE